MINSHDIALDELGRQEYRHFNKSPAATMWMRTKKIITSLYDKRLELVDDTLFETISFGPDSVSDVFGPKDVPPAAQWVTGPARYYSITLTGKVKFECGVKTARFTWDEVEMQEDCLLVKCGFHAKSCRHFYRPTKRFLVNQNSPS